MSEQMMNIVMVILAVGTFIQPMFFGTIFLFMFKWFPTRKEIELMEKMQGYRHEENQSRFTNLESDVKMILRHQTNGVPK